MTEKQPFCFVIMPFLPELNYFYLYIRGHIARVHDIRCERADAEILTIPILEKITAMIESADVLIADCTGRNPNVFYELGIAHKLQKKVILITSEEISQAPSDIRHFEFIKYHLNDSAAFLAKLDNALRNATAERYDQLFVDAIAVYQAFRAATPTQVRVAMASRELFVQRVVRAEDLTSMSNPLEAARFAAFVLPKIVAEATDASLMRQISSYVESIESTHRTELD